MASVVSYSNARLKAEADCFNLEITARLDRVEETLEWDMARISI